MGLSSSHISSHNFSALLSVVLDVVIFAPSEDEVVPARPLFLLLPRRLLPLLALPGEDEEVHMLLLVVLVSALRFFPPVLGMGLRGRG